MSRSVSLMDRVVACDGAEGLPLMARRRRFGQAVSLAASALLSLVLGAACGGSGGSESDGGGDAPTHGDAGQHHGGDARSDAGKPPTDARGDEGAGDTGPAPIRGLRLFFSDLESGPNS